MMIQSRIDGFRDRPDLILTSAKLYHEKYGKLNIDFSVPFDTLAELCDVLLTDDELAKALFITQVCTI
jgi:hypothetical protein